MIDRPNAKQIQEHEERTRTARWNAFYADAAPKHTKATPSRVQTYPVLESEVLQFIRASFPEAQESLIQEWHEAEPPTYENYRYMDGQSHRLILEGTAIGFKQWARVHAKVSLADPKWLELQRDRSY